MHVANVNKKKKKKSALIWQGNIRQLIELQREPQQRCCFSRLYVERMSSGSDVDVSASSFLISTN